MMNCRTEIRPGRKLIAGILGGVKLNLTTRQRTGGKSQPQSRLFVFYFTLVHPGVQLNIMNSRVIALVA